MASLLCDLHFWSAKEEITPKDTDQSTFKYYDKTQHKSMLERPYGQVRTQIKIPSSTSLSARYILAIMANWALLFLAECGLEEQRKRALVFKREQ